jgi:methyltransferase family protein
MLTLPHRHRLPEIMDQPDLRPARHVGALNGLARLNWWSGSAGILWRPLRDLARRLGRPMRVLDAASGGGDVPLRLWRRARRAGLDFRIDGCDRSSVAVDHARNRAAAAGADVRFFVEDVLSPHPTLPPPRGEGREGGTDYDVVTCSLFLHHLGEEEAVAFLRWAAATARARSRAPSQWPRLAPWRSGPGCMGPSSDGGGRSDTC